MTRDLAGRNMVVGVPRFRADTAWLAASRTETTPPDGIYVILSRVLVALPMVSLLAHLCLANWVYKVTFQPLNVAPLLLGFAVLCGHADRHVASLTWRLRMHLCLPLAAILLSGFPRGHDMIIDGPIGRA